MEADMADSGAGIDFVGIGERRQEEVLVAGNRPMEVLVAVGFAGQELELPGFVEEGLLADPVAVVGDLVGKKAEEGELEDLMDSLAAQRGLELVVELDSKTKESQYFLPH